MKTAKTTRPTLVRLGRAKALTRDGLGVQFLEAQIRNGMYPTGG